MRCNIKQHTKHFCTSKFKEKKGKARVIVKITGVSVEPPVKKAPHTSEGFAALEHRQKVTHLNALKAIHGMLESALLWHQKF